MGEHLTPVSSLLEKTSRLMVTRFVVKGMAIRTVSSQNVRQKCQRLEKSQQITNSEALPEMEREIRNGAIDRSAGFHIFELAGALCKFVFTDDHRVGKAAFVGVL